MRTYPVNHRCDYKTLPEMTDEELRQLIDMCPITVGSAASQCRLVPDEIWDEMTRRSKLKTGTS